MAEKTVPNTLPAFHVMIQPKEVYRFLRDEAGAQFIQFIAIVERKNRTGYQEGHKVTDRSVTAKQYGDLLIGVFDEWIGRDVGSVFVQLFDIALAAWVGRQLGLCIFAETCGTALALRIRSIWPIIIVHWALNVFLDTLLWLR